MELKRWQQIGLAGGLIMTAWTAFCGYQWGWGPFAKLHNVKTAKHPGNDAQYAPEKIQPLERSLLKGKHLVFLGSSVTYGSAAGGVSFADYIAARNGCSITKEAVSGTTLVQEGKNSYISRLQKMDENMEVDLFVCQLSTNDATQKKPLGIVGASKNLAEFDTKTVAGAIEYIVCYVRETWGCPVVFYTNPKYESESYAQLVALLYEIKAKWNIAVIDMWNETAFSSVAEEQRFLYMADHIHPTKAGYLQWWTPYIETGLYQAIGRDSVNASGAPDLGD